MKLRRATLADAAAVGRIHVESWNTRTYPKTEVLDVRYRIRVSNPSQPE